MSDSSQVALQRAVSLYVNNLCKALVACQRAVDVETALHQAVADLLDGQEAAADHSLPQNAQHERLTQAHAVLEAELQQCKAARADVEHALYSSGRFALLADTLLSGKPWLWCCLTLSILQWAHQRVWPR